MKKVCICQKLHESDDQTSISELIKENQEKSRKMSEYFFVISLPEKLLKNSKLQTRTHPHPWKI